MFWCLFIEPLSYASLLDEVQRQVGYYNNIVSLGGAALLMSSTCAAPVALIVKLWTTLKRPRRCVLLYFYNKYSLPHFSARPNYFLIRMETY